VLLRFPDLGLNRINSELRLGACQIPQPASATMFNDIIHWNICPVCKGHRGSQVQTHGVCGDAGSTWHIDAIAHVQGTISTIGDMVLQQKQGTKAARLILRTAKGFSSAQVHRANHRQELTRKDEGNQSWVDAETRPSK
jgi:hypothetical protein